MARSFFSAMMADGATFFFNADFSTVPAAPAYTCPDDKVAEIHEVKIVCGGGGDWTTGFGGVSLTNGFQLGKYDSAGTLVDSYLPPEVAADVAGLVAFDFVVTSDVTQPNMRALTWKPVQPIVLQAGQSLRWTLADDFSTLEGPAFIVRGSI